MNPNWMINTKNHDDNFWYIDKESSNSLHDFLLNSKWVAIRNVESLVWDGRCSFVSVDVKEYNEFGCGDERKNELSTFWKRDILKAWSSVMSNSTLHKTLNGETVDGVTLEDKSSESTVVAEVWKRLMDQVADISYKADLQKLGEDCLFSHLGEFRHYLVEKVVFNKQNKLAGMEIASVSTRIIVILHISL